MQRCYTSESGSNRRIAPMFLRPLSDSFFLPPSKTLRGNGALAGEEDEEVEEVKERRMEEGEGGGEGRLRREQSAGLGCSGSPEAALGSAFTPSLQQCEAAARAACCSRRLTAKQGRGLLRTLDSGFCSSAARHAPAPTSLHTHAAPLLLWVFFFFFLCMSVLVLYLCLKCYSAPLSLCD